MAAGGVTRARGLLAVAVALALAAIVLAAMLLNEQRGSDAFVDSRPPPDLAESFYPPEGWAWGELQGAEAARCSATASPAPRSRLGPTC